MPTITALAWKSLLEPGSPSSSSSTKPSPLPPTNQQQHHHRTTTSTTSDHARSPYYISRDLYATPDLASIPDSSPPSPSSSLYVLNHKRRLACPAASSEAATTRPDGFGIQRETDADPTHESRLAGTSLVEEAGERAGEAEGENGLDAEWNGEGLADDDGSEQGCGHRENDELFFDPRESMSIASSSEAEDGGILRRAGSHNGTSLTNQSDFYDAAEDFFSDGSISRSSLSFGANSQIELRALKLNVLEEIEKRKRAEEALLRMQNQWQMMAKCLCHMGLSFPENLHSRNVQFQTDPVALCQEIIVARFVSELIERGLARAETEAVLESVIELKDHEISRLRDRLQYYEAMNREMSQRNQEGVELARQQRLRRKTRRRWMWSCIGFSIAVGASLLAYSYLPPPRSGEGPPSTCCPAAEFGESEADLIG